MVSLHRGGFWLGRLMVSHDVSLLCFWSRGIVAESTGFQRSSRIASIAEANCLLEIPKDKGALPKGTAGGHML